MSYLSLSDIAGQPKIGGGKFLPGVPHVLASKFGSKKSNNGTANRRTAWWNQYASKNSARQNRASRQG